MRPAAFAVVLTFGLADAASGAGLAGTVRDAVTARPVAGARVEAAGRSALSADDGRFAVDVPRWPATIVASRSGFRVARQEITSEPAGEIQILLEPIVSYSDRIEVTATRAREGLDPATFTNIPAERVSECYWGQDPAILIPELAPGFLAYNDSGNGIGYSYFTVRGFGQARTRVTLNGAPLNDAESGELFFIDLADFLATSGDIQLGRGVFGLSGIGGSLDITTRSPGVERSLALEGGTGSFGTHRLVARYESGLLGGRWSLVARYSNVRSDGYREQSWVKMWNGFLSLSRFGSRSTLKLVTFGGPEKTHLAYDGIPRSALEGGLTGSSKKDRRTNPIRYPGEIDDFFQPHFQVVHDLKLGPATRLAQTLYAFRGEGSYEQLRLGRRLAEYNLPDVVLPDGTTIAKSDLVRKRVVEEWDYGWVPTLSHRHGAFLVTASGELRLHRARHWGEVRWAQYYPAGVEPNRHYYDYHARKQTETVAARLAWDASGYLTLSAGLQATHQGYTMSDDRIKAVSFDEGYGFLLPRAGAVVHLSKDADAYLNVARGGREPNFRQIYDPEDYYAVRAGRLAPEDVVDYELGLSLRRSAWRTRLNAFLMDFKNEIVYAGALDDNGVPIYGNGARSRHRGIEGEASWTPSPHFGLDGHLALSRNTFTDYLEHGWDGGTISYRGNRIAGYPDFMGALTLRTAFGPARISLTGRHVGRFYLDNTEDDRKDPAARTAPGYLRRVNPAYGILDATLRTDLPKRWPRRIGARRMGLELRVNNLLDNRYTAFGYMDGEPLFIPAATRALYLGLSLKR